MNKLVIGKMGYDFQRENLDFISNLQVQERLNLFYVLPNYSILEDTRKALVEKIGAIKSDNIMTFDDLANRYAKGNYRFIEREIGNWITKKIIEKDFETDLANTHGTAQEIFSYILKLKSLDLSARDFSMQTKDIYPLNEIALVYEKYEGFLQEKNLEDEIGKYLIAKENIKNLKVNNKGRILIYGFIEFRPNELDLLKEFSNIGYEIIIQYPYLMEKENLKLQKLINDLENLNFSIEYIDEKINGNRELSYELFSKSQNKSSSSVTEIKASTKYYEVREIFNDIKKNLELEDIKEFSIIASEEYDEILRSFSKKNNIPLSIMNEENGKDLPIVRGVINLLEFIKDESLVKLINFLLDENFNINFTKDLEYILENLRDIEYKGLFGNYEELDIVFTKFIEDIKNFVIDFRNAPLKSLSELIEEICLDKKIIESFQHHKDLEILANSLRGLEVLKDNITSISEFNKLIGLSKEEELEIITDVLKESKYYINKNIQGLKILRPINSIGVKTKYRYICGLNSEYPNIKTENYLYNNRFSNLYSKLGLKIEDKYESLDNELLVFAQTVANADNLVCSYVYEDIDLKEEKSIFFKDLLRRIEDENIKRLSSSSMVKDEISKFDTITDKNIFNIFKNKGNDIELNYENKENVENLNNILFSYNLRVSGEPTYRGNFKNPINIINMNQLPVLVRYSSSMLDTYNSCPFKFYVKYILGYKKIDLEGKDEFEIEKGNYYHEILKELYSALDIFNMEESDLVEAIDSAVVKKLEEKKIDPNEREVRRKIYTQFLLDFIISDKKVHEELEKKFLPRYFEQNFNNKIEDIEIYGRIDRIDESESGDKLIYDYKSNTTPTISSVNNLENIQLPIYALLVSEYNANGGFYGSIQKGSIEKIFYLDELFPNKKDKGKKNSQELLGFYGDTKNLIKNIDSDIKMGIFNLNPINDKICRYCDYRDICRKEEII